MNMKALFSTLCFALVFICASVSHGMFAFYQTKKVPIDRVLKHCELELAKNTNSVLALYHLARIHSMAYATNLQVVAIMTNDYGSNPSHYSPVFKYPGSDTGVPDSVMAKNDYKSKALAQQHLSKAIDYYQRAAALVAKQTNDSRWLSPPIHIGLAWSLDQAGKRDEAIKAYRRALKLSWETEIEPMPTIKEQANWSWDQLRAMKNPFGRPPSYLGPGICYSEEIMGYLLKLLDPVKDKKEIAQLMADQKKVQAMGRAITPILVSLCPDTPLEQLINPTAGVAFDLDGSGFQRRWGWITPKAAWLVFDKDGTGRITSGLQMFGNVTFWIFWRDGYDALSSLDDDGDGVLRGDELRGVSLWQDLNDDGICDPGEVRPVTDWGIKEIRCKSEIHPTGIPFNPRGVELRDGTTRATFDWIAKSTEPVE